MKKKRIWNASSMAVVMLLILIPAAVHAGGQQAGTGNAEGGGSAEGPVSFSINMKTPIKVPTDLNEVYALNYIKEKFDVTFQIDLFPADVTQFRQRLNLLAAADSLPDIISTWNDFQVTAELAQEGFLYEIPEEMIEEYCPTVIKTVPAYAFEKYKVNDKTYTVPSALNPNYVALYARGDWMENLSIEEPETLDDFENMLRAFTFEDPDGNGKDDTYGYGERNVWGSTFAPIFGAFGIIPFYWTEYDGGVVMGLCHPKAIDVLTILQNWYKEGLIDREWITTSTDDWFSKIGMGKLGVAVAGIGTHYKLNDLVTASSPGGFMRKIPFPKGPAGRGGIQSYGDTGMSYVFNKNIKHVERFLEIYDYATTDEGLALFYYGEEGKHYRVKEEGGVEMLISEEEQVRLGIGNGNQPFFEISGKMWNMVDKFVGENELIGYKYCEESNILDALAKSTRRIETVDKYGSINDVLLQGIFQVIVGKETPANYRNYVDEWYAKGGREITDEANDIYHDMAK